MAPQVVARTCVFDKLPILRPVHVKRADVDRIVAESRQNATVSGETPASAKKRLTQARSGCSSSLARAAA